LDQRPQLAVEFSPVEPFWLEILVGFHAIDRFAQFVEICDSVAVAIGIKKPPYGFGHDVQLVDGQVASVPIHPLEIIPGSSTIFRRRSSPAADAGRKSTFWIKGQSPLKPNVQLPIGREVVFQAEIIRTYESW
jgi:hypothetical protein